MKQKLEKMLELQDAMNSKVNPNWKQAGNSWVRAMWIEAAEMMDHYGWKWWKKQDPNVEQVKMELVDIWHFALSWLIEADQHEEFIGPVEYITQGFDQLQGYNEMMMSDDVTKNYHDFLNTVESFVSWSLYHRTLNVIFFASMMEQVGMTFDELYQMYIGKNVLNFFRQDNGYKDGTYIKDWNGQEDNEVLAQIMSEINMDVEDVDQVLYTALNAYYQNNVLKAA